MKISQEGIDLICSFEDMILKPYKDPANTPTIGYGNIFYENGNRVSLEDSPITKGQALELLKYTLNLFEIYVNSCCIKPLNQNQFDALVSICYSIGPNNFKNSKLLILVNRNPDNPKIKDEFYKWNKTDGNKLAGLILRRKKEADFYFRV